MRNGGAGQEYEPFGALLPGRNYSSTTDSYRFGFQGQEKDDEIHGASGTSYAFEYRMHDPRVGRFLSIDPLAAKYPHNSPYAFSENRVLDRLELEGLESVQLQVDGRYQHQFPLISVTVSGNLGLAVDIHGGVGILLTGGLGIGEGGGWLAGVTMNFSMADVAERAGPGFDIGVGQTMKISGLGEGWNGEVTYSFDNYGEGGPGFIGGSKSLDGLSTGCYVGGYGELTGTALLWEGQIGELSEDAYSTIQGALGWDKATTDQMLTGMQQMAVDMSNKFKQQQAQNDQYTPGPVRELKERTDMGNWFGGLLESIGLRSPQKEPPAPSKEATGQ